MIRHIVRGMVLSTVVAGGVVLTPARSSHATATAPMYTVLNLGGSPAGINNSGQVVGNLNHDGFRTGANWPVPNSPPNPATDTLGRWTGGPATNPTAINDAGQVAGTAYDVNYNQSPFRTRPNAPLQGSDRLFDWGASAWGMNSSGQVVGEANYVYLHGAYRTTGTGVVDVNSMIGSFGGDQPNVHAFGVNDLGQAVGSASCPSTQKNPCPVPWVHAYRTAPNGVITGNSDLGSLGTGQDIHSQDSEARAVNNAGQTVGNTHVGNTSPETIHAFITSKNGDPLVMTDLGVIAGHPDTTGSTAYAINGAGVVVGRENLSGAFYWTADTGMVDLNTRLTGPGLTGVKLWNATGINDHGQIIATGDVNGSTAYFLLTPVTSQPILYSLSPGTTVAAGQPITLTLTGVSFNATSTVRWNGMDVATHFDAAKPDTLTADVPASDLPTGNASAAEIQVRNGDGQFSNIQPFYVTTQAATITGSNSGKSTTPGGTASVSAGGNGANADGGTGSITIANYSSNPVAPATFSNPGPFADVHLDVNSTFTSATVTLCNAAGKSGLFFFLGTTWHQLSNVTTLSNGCLLGQFNPSDLHGTVIAAGSSSPTAAAASRVHLTRVHGRTIVRWYAARPVLGFLVFDGTHQLDRHLVTSHTHWYHFSTAAPIRHLRLAAVVRSHR